MTEKKRFVIKTVEEDCIFDNRDCKYYDELDMTIALLNELSDENGQLDTKCSQLKEENEQLKQQINNTIKELQTEKETAISKNERIRLDFAITVLEELKGDKDD